MGDDDVTAVKALPELVERERAIQRVRAQASHDEWGFVLVSTADLMMLLEALAEAEGSL